MQLIGANTTTFSLTILGYEFPNHHHTPYDADWLNIRIEASDHRGRWSSTAHCLLTWEVAQLADWFDALTTMIENDKHIDFMEPNLRFVMTTEPSALRIYFDKQSRPPWDPSRFGLGEKGDAWIELTSPLEGLAAASTALRDDLQRFPVRVGKPPRHNLES